MQLAKNKVVREKSKMIRKLIKKILKKKEAGASDLIASMVVVLALTVFVLFFIHAIGDVETRTRIDQVARKYILRMESTGTLTTDEENAIKAELQNIPSVKQAVGLGGTITVTSNAKNTNAGYGNVITLRIDCPACVTSWNAGGTAFGLVKRNTYTTYVIEKQSTAKY